MSAFTVHGIPGSPFGRTVLLTFEEKHAPYHFARVAPGTLRSGEHLARHPFARVPVLEHGDFRLYETAAIVRYLDRVLPGPALTPVDARRAARMDLLMNVNDWYLFQGVGNVIGFQRVVGPRLFGLSPDEQAIAAVLPRAQAVLDELSRSLGEQPYFTGDQVTLADLMLAPQLEFLSQTPEWAPLTARSANLPAWLERMAARPSMQATTWERVAALPAAA